jgi:hypothetical protein
MAAWPSISFGTGTRKQPNEELEVDNLKMFGRYAIAIGVSYATAKGWISASGGDALTKLLVELGAVAIAFGPAVYAAMKVDNAPKT